jgi:ABC-type multidrug transport system ATPase subunit
MLAMGRAIMSRPKLLLLDEPSMGLAPLMVQKVFETVLAISGEGVTILLIEQNAKLALEVSNRGYVMESGTITLSGDARDLLSNPKVREAYSASTCSAGDDAQQICAVGAESLRRSERSDDSIPPAVAIASSTSTEETRAAGGPTRAQAIIASTAGAGPLTSASTRPSRRLRTTRPARACALRRRRHSEIRRLARARR